MRDLIGSIRWLDAVDRRVTGWMADHGIPILRVALGVVFVWFGALKLVPGLSPAEDLVRATVPFLPGDLFLRFSRCGRSSSASAFSPVGRCA
jgi:hypothetical protein